MGKYLIQVSQPGEPNSLPSEPTLFAPTLPRPPGYLATEEHAPQNGSGIFGLSPPFIPPHSLKAVRGPELRALRGTDTGPARAQRPYAREQTVRLKAASQSLLSWALLKDGLKIVFDDVETHRYLM